MKIIKILDNALAPGSSAIRKIDDFSANNSASFQCTVSGSGLVSAHVDFKISNDRIGWITAASFVLSGTDTDTAMMRIIDFNFDNQIFLHYKADITSVSGTNALINLTALV